MVVRLQIWRRVWLRRLISLAVVVSICASFFPLPVASRTPGKDRSTPFPCQDRPCGCRSAEQCWKSCCCFSDTEKIAWAKANGVTPPQFVVEAASTETVETVVSEHSCCNRHEDSNQAVIEKSPSPHSCCSHPQPTSASSANEVRDTTDRRGKETQSGTTHVLGIMVQRCQGSGLYWHSLPWSVLPPVPMTAPQRSPVMWSHPVSVEVDERLIEPPVPPPRLLMFAISFV